MACLLTQGYNFAGCKGGGGGISEVLITELGNITGIALTANAITGITMTTGTQFRRYILDKEMGDFSCNGTYTEASGTWTYDHMSNFTVKGLTLALQAEIKLVAQNTLGMIIRDRNGVYWLLGIGSVLADSKGMNLMTVTSGSGKALTDFAGFNLAFAGKETDYVHSVSSSIIAALLSPAV